MIQTGTSLMDHLLKFDKLCRKLRSAGDGMDDDEKLVLLWEVYHLTMLIWCHN